MLQLSPMSPGQVRAGGRECFPLALQNLGAAPCLPQDPHHSQPQVWVPPHCACQHPSGGDGHSPEEWGVSAATACDQGPQTPSMEVPSGLLRTWMWYLTPGHRSRRTTQVLAWTSPCRRGASLRSGCGSQIPLPIPGPSMYLTRSRGGCSCPSHGCVGADGWMGGGVPRVLPTGVQCGTAGHLCGAGRVALHLVEEEVRVVGEWRLPRHVELPRGPGPAGRDVCWGGNETCGEHARVFALLQQLLSGHCLALPGHTCRLPPGMSPCRVLPATGVGRRIGDPYLGTVLLSLEYCLVRGTHPPHPH